MSSREPSNSRGTQTFSSYPSRTQVARNARSNLFRRLIDTRARIPRRARRAAAIYSRRRKNPLIKSPPPRLVRAAPIYNDVPARHRAKEQCCPSDSASSSVKRSMTDCLDELIGREKNRIESKSNLLDMNRSLFRLTASISVASLKRPMTPTCELLKSFQTMATDARVRRVFDLPTSASQWRPNRIVLLRQTLQTLRLHERENCARSSLGTHARRSGGAALTTLSKRETRWTQSEHRSTR